MIGLSPWKIATCIAAILVSLPVHPAGILVLKSQTPSEEAALNDLALEGFRQAYSGPSTVTEGRRDFLRSLANERPWLVVSVGAQAAEIARDAARALPLVYMLGPDPGKLGPSGSGLGGVASDVPADEQLRHFRELLPNLRALGAIHHGDRAPASLRAATMAARRLGIELLAVPAHSADDVRTAFALVGKRGVIDALWIWPDAALGGLNWPNLLQDARERGLPLLVHSEAQIRAGALAGVIPDYREVGRQCGEMVTQLAQGTLRPANLAREAPRSSTLVINSSSARELRVTIPQSVQGRARIVP